MCLFNSNNSEIVILKQQITDLTNKNNDLLKHTSDLNITIDSINILNKQLTFDIATIKSQLEEKKNPLEEFWNNKRPKANVYYKGRPLIGSTTNIDLDLRNFINPNDCRIPNIQGLNDDEKAINGLKWVHNNFKYVADKTQWGMSELWQFPFESLQTLKGDCEDGAILLYNILLKSGIQYWKLRLNAGDVKGGGHCWLTYLRESDNSWVILDWCYWTDLQPIATRKKYNEMENYFDIWFSWNQKYCFNDTVYVGINGLDDKIIIQR